MRKTACWIVCIALLTATCCAYAGEVKKFDPPVSVSTVMQLPDGVTDDDLPDGDDLQHNVWTRLYEDDLGISLNYQWIAQLGAQFTEKANLMIASGNLPDVFPVTATQLDQLCQAGLLADQTDAFAQYATERTRKLIFEGGDGAYNSAMRDGKLMALPFTTNTKEGGLPMIIVRSDWEKELGLTGIHSWADFAAYLEAFKGKSGSDYGFAGTSDLSTFNYLFAAFKAYPEIWIAQEDGSVAYGGIQPEVREALLALQDLYAKGLIDKEFGSKDAGRVDEALVSGNVGLAIGYYWAPLAAWQSLRSICPEVGISAYPIPTVEGGPATFGHSLGIQWYWVVNKDFAYPEVVTMMLNTFTDKFYYANDADYLKYQNNESGAEIWELSLVRAYRTYKNLDGYVHVRDVLNGKAAEADLSAFERGEYRHILDYRNGDDFMWCWAQMYTEGETFAVVEKYKADNLYLLNAYNGASTPAMIENEAILDKLQLETFTKIIQGEDISAFDKFVDSWLLLGGEEITREVNEALK